jgi:polar amino acid transport system substrate-binding protein
MRIRTLILCAAASLAGCGGEPAGPKAIRVGTEAAYFPFEYQEGGEIKGFDADLIRAIGRELGRPIDLQNVEFQGLVPGIDADKIDAAISCVTITDERRKQVDFSDPYYDAGQIVAVRAEETAIRSKEDCRGKRLGAQSNTTGLAQARQLGGSEVKEYEDVNMAFQDLVNGQIDAVINDEPVSRRLAATKPGLKVVGDVFTNEQYGIVVKKGNAALLADINRALKKIRESGELDKLKEKWITKPAK